VGQTDNLPRYWVTTPNLSTVWLTNVPPQLTHHNQHPLQQTHITTNIHSLVAEQKEKKPLVPYLQQQSIMEPTNKKSKTDPMENKWERDLSSIGANVRGMRAELTKFVNSTIRKEVFDELLSAANFAATTGNKVAVAEYQLAIVALVKKNNTARNKEFCEDVYELAEPNSSGEDIPDMSILPADCQPKWNPPK